MRSTLLVCVIVALVGLTCASAQAITIETETVGNAGNAADSRTGLGAVAYSYNIGEVEVTNEQYVDFLNALAGDYAALAAKGLVGSNTASTGITNVGSVWSVADGLEDKPASAMEWEGAVRFANWMNTGDTETGPYGISGTTFTVPNAAQRAALATGPLTWLLPSEDEWYKAAFNHGMAAGDYYDYPTSSSTAPTAALPSPTANTANFSGVLNAKADVGSYTGTLSPYGAFDMAGNVWEFTDKTTQQIRGAGYPSGAASTVYTAGANTQGATSVTVGLRLASVGVVPEPGTIAMLVGVALTSSFCYWRKRS